MRLILRLRREKRGAKRGKKKRADKISQGRDEYTGKSVSADGTIELSNGHIVRAELDHVVSVHEIHTNPKVHLALGKVRKMRKQVN